MDGNAAAGGASAAPGDPGSPGRRSAVALALLALAALPGCRSREATKEPAGDRGAGKPAVAARAGGGAESAPPPSLALGVAGLGALRWREGGGQEAFRRARTAERQGDWAAMVARCEEALAADPAHLEASWLLAAGLSHLKRFSEVSAPLAVAVAGDPGKWAQPALQLPLFAPYWESGQGERLRPWISALAPRLGEALARSVLLLHRGRLVAYDRQGARWFPLGRRASVLGALIARPRLLYVARGRLAGGRPGQPPPSASSSSSSAGLLLGLVDLRTGASREVALPPGQRHELVEVPAPTGEPRVLVRAERGPWQEVQGEQLVAATAAPPRELSPRLVIAKGRAQVVRLPLAGIAADWDQAAMASALRIRRSNRLVAPPAPALIDGQRVQWSPASTRLALVASLEDCDKAAEPGAAAPPAGARRTLAYVVDPITGASREVAQSAAGLELQWIGEQLLAVASDRGVELIDLAAGLAAGSSELLEGELSLALPVLPTRCAVEPAAGTSQEPPLLPGDDLDDL